jgi:hypothetical protein
MLLAYHICEMGTFMKPGDGRKHWDSFQLKSLILFKLQNKTMVSRLLKFTSK